MSGLLGVGTYLKLCLYGGGASSLKTKKGGASFAKGLEREGGLLKEKEKGQGPKGKIALLPPLSRETEEGEGAAPGAGEPGHGNS